MDVFISEQYVFLFLIAHCFYLYIFCTLFFYVVFLLGYYFLHDRMKLVLRSPLLYI